MKLEKRELDPVKWDVAVQNLLNRTWSQRKAAEFLEIPPMTLHNHLKYAKLLDQVTGGKHGNAGTNSRAAKEDPERYQRYIDAVNFAIKFNNISLAATKYDVTYQVLARKVRAEKAARQQPKAA